MTRILLITLLASGLTACATAPLPVRVNSYPPAELARDCAYPTVDVSTNGSLAAGVLSYHYALELCNLDKAALREWVDTTRKAEDKVSK